jgi:hypothetical protein
MKREEIVKRISAYGAIGFVGNFVLSKRTVGSETNKAGIYSKETGELIAEMFIGESEGLLYQNNICMNRGIVIAKAPIIADEFCPEYGIYKEGFWVGDRVWKIGSCGMYSELTGRISTLFLALPWSGIGSQQFLSLKRSEYDDLFVAKAEMDRDAGWQELYALPPRAGLLYSWSAVKDKIYLVEKDEYDMCRVRVIAQKEEGRYMIYKEEHRASSRDEDVEAVDNVGKFVGEWFTEVQFS